MSLIFVAETVTLGQAQSSQAPAKGTLYDVFFAVCYVARGKLSLESGLLPLPLKPLALTSRLAEGGAPVLVIAGQEGQLYRIEQSTDLNGWKVFRLVEGLAKPVEVSVPAAPAGGTRFYRTVTP